MRGSRFILGAVAAAMAALPLAAQAQYYGGYGGGYDRPAAVYEGYHDGSGDHRVDYDRGNYDRGDAGRRADGRRYRCRADGSGGAIVGAIAGGLLGNAVAGYGDRAAGTLLGGVGGALAGRAIDRDC